MTKPCYSYSLLLTIYTCADFLCHRPICQSLCNRQVLDPSSRPSQQRFLETLKLNHKLAAYPSIISLTEFDHVQALGERCITVVLSPPFVLILFTPSHLYFCLTHGLLVRAQMYSNSIIQSFSRRFRMIWSGFALNQEESHCSTLVGTQWLAVSLSQLSSEQYVSTTLMRTPMHRVRSTICPGWWCLEACKWCKSLPRLLAHTRHPKTKHATG